MSIEHRIRARFSQTRNPPWPKVLKNKLKKEEPAAPEAPAAAAKPAAEGGEETSNEDVLANFDEDFDEFTPAEE